MQIDFDEIYTNNSWGSRESRSGSGSELANTYVLIAKLQELFLRLDIHSILDIPCGDFNWMRTVDLSGIEYIGADIVNKLLSYLHEHYPTRKFEKLDVRHDKLPKVDLVFCRDCLVHLDFADGIRAIRNILSSQSRYLAITTFPEHTNDELSPYGWRPLNMELPPFNFPRHVLLINEELRSLAHKDKSIGVYDLTQIRMDDAQ